MVSAILLGSGFGTGATVTFNAVSATGVTVVDSHTITCTVPDYTGTITSEPISAITVDGEVVSAYTKLVDVVVTNVDSTTSTLVHGYMYYRLVNTWWCITDPEICIFSGTQPPPISVGGPGSPPSPFAPSTAPDDRGFWLSIDDKYLGAAMLVNNDSVPRAPRSFTEINTFAAGSVSKYSFLGGSPGVMGVWNNHLVYARGEYTVGTDRPPIHLFNGLFNEELALIPPTTAGVIPKGMMTLLVADGQIFFTTLDSGTTSSDFSGRAFSLTVETGVVAQLGAAFPAGHVPYALAWHNDRLWCGTNRKTPADAGKIYYFRPNIDTEWTEDHNLTADSMGGVASMLSWNGLLYVGCTAAAGTFAKVLVRGTDDTYTTSDTGVGGTARENNGFLALADFNDLLIATFYNPDASAISLIRKFTGSAWSTVYSQATDSLVVPYIALTSDQGIILAVGGNFGANATLVSSPDGTNWTNRTAFLGQSTSPSTGLPACGVITV